MASSIGSDAAIRRKIDRKGRIAETNIIFSIMGIVSGPPLTVEKKIIFQSFYIF